MVNFKGGFAFNNEAAKVEVEQAPDGTLISCVNPVTGEELGGGGGFEPFSGTITLKNNLSSTAYLAFPCTNGGKEIIKNVSAPTNTSITITTALLINGLFYVGAARSNSAVHFNATGAEFVDQAGTSAYTCGTFRPTAETVEITLNTI